MRMYEQYYYNVKNFILFNIFHNFMLRSLSCYPDKFNYLTRACTRKVEISSKFEGSTERILEDQRRMVGNRKKMH